MNMDFILSNFMERHGVVHNIYRLKEYVEFLTNYNLKNPVSYTERHHILPAATFPEFINAPWNIIELDYQDHRKAHKLLFESIHIRQYQYPLNFMLREFKDSEKISIATKIAWTKLKSDKAKYNNWVSKRSKHMKSLSSDEQRRRANIFWNNISEENRELFSKKMKSYWTEDKKIEKSNQMKEYYTNEMNVAKKSEETRLRWLEMSESDRENFNNKMSEINKNPSKRALAGIKIRDLWRSEGYLEKMKNRKHREGKSIKLVYVDGKERVFKTIKEMSEEYNLSLYLIRKYRNTDMVLQERDLETENMCLLGCKIITT